MHEVYQHKVLFSNTMNHDTFEVRDGTGWSQEKHSEYFRLLM